MSQVNDRPFTVTSKDDLVTITIHADACEQPEMLTCSSQDWIRQVKGHIRINFSQVKQVNSTLVAWLFQLVQWGPPGEMELEHANHRIRKQLKQFHLQHFIVFPMDDIESSAMLPGTR